MDEEIIGSYELKMVSEKSPMPQIPEPPSQPEPSTPQTNWMEAALTRRQAIIIQVIMFAVLLSIITYNREQEKHDISNVRAEQKASSEAILTQIQTNNQGAIQRSSRISAGIDQLIGRVDALTLELTKESGIDHSTERKPSGNAP